MKRSKEEREMGLRIMKLRMDRGYSRERFAEMVGISASFLYEIETNRKGFSATTLRQFCKAFRISSDYILYGDCDSDYVEVVAQTVGRFEADKFNKIVELLEVVYDMVYEGE